MYCASCKKQAPEGAAFCPFCGQSLDEIPFLEEEEIVQPQAKAAHAAHRPQAASQDRLVIPLVENPAQPLRRSGKSPAARQIKETGLHLEEEVSPYSREGQQKEEEKKASSARLSRKNTARETDDAGRTVPPRQAPVAPRKRENVNTDPCLIPPRRRARLQEDPYAQLDAEYLDEDDSGEEYLEKMERRGKNRRRWEEEEYLEEQEERSGQAVRSIVTGAALLVLLGVIFYFLVMPGGQKLCAQMGLGAPASAYAALGEDYARQGDDARAAQAWYDALSRDPDNYEYALMVAQTQKALGRQDKALTAYAKCISLKPHLPQPYGEVAALYEQMGDRERAANALKTGYDRTGDISLFRAWEQISAQLQTP